MYSPHSALTEPGDGANLWRYMHFAKFVALLDSQALYFARLGSLPDRFEGHLSKPTIERIRSARPSMTAEEIKRRKAVADHNVRFFATMRSVLCVSCWHVCDAESDAMWGSYLKGQFGIAIRSRFDRFKTSLAASTQDVHGCVVEYIDYEKTEIDERNAFNLAKYKRIEFAQDREFRGVIMMPGRLDVGELVAVNVNQLIAEVRVEPHSRTWMVDLVSKVAKRYGLAAPVEPSKLAAAPVYLGE